MRGRPVDRTPVVNPTSVATVELMDLVDAPFPDANREPELMARLAATGYTELGFDSIMPVFSIIQESSALGCKIQWEQKDNWPTVKMREPIYESPDDIRIPDDLLDHPDTQCVLEAIRILRRRFGDEVAIIGKTMGPWSLAYHTFGVEPFLLLSLDDPAATKLVLDRLKEIDRSRSGSRRSRPAPTPLTLPDHATGDLVSGEYYQRYLRDMHVEFAERIPGPIILHICGKTVDRMDYIAADRHGRVPLRLEERARRSRWRPWRAGSVSSATSTTPRRCTRKGPPRCRAEVGREPRGGRRRWSAPSAPSRSRPRSRTCSPSATPCRTGMRRTRRP